MDKDLITNNLVYSYNQISNLTNCYLTTLNHYNNLQDEANKLKQDIDNEYDSWMIKLSKMSKDELKDFGSNEEIRKAKIKSNMIEAYNRLDQVQTNILKATRELEKNRLLLSQMKKQSDILITLLNSINITLS